MQDIEKKLEKNGEERAEILQRICANKTAGDQKDGDIESEIADVKNTQEELRSTQKSFSLQVLKNWANNDSLTNPEWQVEKQNKVNSGHQRMVDNKLTEINEESERIRQSIVSLRWG